MWTCTITKDTDDPNIFTVTAIFMPDTVDPKQANTPFTYSRRMKAGGGDESNFIDEARAAYDKHRDESSERDTTAEMIAAKLNG